jgi:hypothetical protein
MLRQLLCIPILFVALLAAPSALADLQVNVRTDVVVLTDGTRIECIVLMVTGRGVLIVEQDPEDKEKTRQRVIPAADVKDVINGKAEGMVTGFQTEFELTHKVIQGSGFRKETSKKVAKKDPKDPNTPQTPPKKFDPADTGNAVKVTPDKTPVAPGSKVNPRELSEAYLSRFPVLKSAAQNLIGLDKIPQLIEAAQKGDPLARRQVEGFLKIFLTDSSQLVERPAVQAPVGPGVKPPRQPRQPRSKPITPETKK